MEHKTLNDHRVLSLHFPNATSDAYSISNVPHNRFHVQHIEETRTYQNKILLVTNFNQCTDS